MNLGNPKLKNTLQDTQIKLFLPFYTVHSTGFVNTQWSYRRYITVMSLLGLVNKPLITTITV
jgi:hypothetical protein